MTIAPPAHEADHRTDHATNPVTDRANVLGTTAHEQVVFFLAAGPAARDA